MFSFVRKNGNSKIFYFLFGYCRFYGPSNVIVYNCKVDLNYTRNLIIKYIYAVCSLGMMWEV